MSIRSISSIFYEKFLTEQYTWRPKVDELTFDSIDHSSAAWLERPFDENEVLGVLKAKRLSEVLGKIILKSQNTFVKGRQIIDSVLIANECLESRVRSGIPARFSVLVNGTPESFFNNSQGLRQRDPLSLLLFILVIDVLSRMLRRAVEGGFLFGFTMGGSTHGSLTVSYLLFADDTLIFCDLDQEQFYSLRALLLCFEIVLGLKVNLSKSEVILVGSVNNVSMVAAILGCKVSSLPMKYLGLPLGVPHKSKTVWEGII
ncbi:uncharacterized protein LOC122301777 [Carya illinoinensis]|uniref:uncharacterized protein LOC122301777 n=1 Tax=Carya illinoinensis TaxID=32201 RepID=UPI001C71F95C|nr:uncharacterized protein LOC122301777 [Carya illinoinensis]